MNYRWGIVFIALLLLCMAGVAIHSSRPDEVYYHGKSLSRWLDQLDDQPNFEAAGNAVVWHVLPPKTRQQIEAADAIRAMGTNAMPRLMHDLSVNDSQLFELSQRVQQYFREKILHQPRRNRFPLVSPAQKIQSKAALAMDALGPAAQSAIPQLASMANKPTSPSSCKGASFILAGMGPAGIDALTNLPPSANPWNWRLFCAIWAIGQHPQSSTNLVPWLLDLATPRPPSPAVGLNGGEIWALGEIHANAARVVPFLIEALSNTNGLQSFAAEALGHYGKEASNAVPALRKMKADPQFGAQAQEALDKINSDLP
jgi:hypothetical protein